MNFGVIFDHVWTLVVIRITINFVNIWKFFYFWPPSCYNLPLTYNLHRYKVYLSLSAIRYIHVHFHPYTCLYAYLSGCMNWCLDDSMHGQLCTSGWLYACIQNRKLSRFYNGTAVAIFFYSDCVPKQTCMQPSTHPCMYTYKHVYCCMEYGLGVYVNIPIIWYLLWFMPLIIFFCKNPKSAALKGHTTNSINLLTTYITLCSQIIFKVEFRRNFLVTSIATSCV